MAKINFFDAFLSAWAQNGQVEDVDPTQYQLGWSFIGATPPSVEQFNLVHQIADQKSNWLFGQLQAAATRSGITLSAGDMTGLIKVLDSLPVASTSQAGIVALATNAATQAGTASNVAVTPASLSARTATEGRTGLVELATAAEVRAGTDATRAVTPAGLQSKVATTAQAQAMTDNTALITPKSLGDALGVAALGRGQKWRVVTGSRAIGVTYTNTTKAPIAVVATVAGTTANSTVACAFTVHSGPDLVPGIFSQAYVTNAIPTHWSPAAFAIVPPGEAYALAATQATITYWMELRL